VRPLFLTIKKENSVKETENRTVRKKYKKVRISTRLPLAKETPLYL